MSLGWTAVCRIQRLHTWEPGYLSDSLGTEMSPRAPVLQQEDGRIRQLSAMIVKEAKVVSSPGK